MAESIYLLCGLTSLFCAVLLFRGWQRSRQRLLLFSAFCFAGLALNNVILIVDFVLVPDTDLVLLRHATALASFAVLLWGLVWEAR